MPVALLGPLAVTPMALFCAAYLLIGSLLRTVSPAGGDAEVSCVFMDSCILPCSFQDGTDVVIHWTLVNARQTSIHSYYYSSDQLGDQDQRFRGRTSLFKEQISRGNTSLQLTGVEVQDEGKYRCYISTITVNKESDIFLKVDAPVRKVDIQQVDNRITCSSEGIFPEPELTWSSSSPSNETFKNTTTVQQTEQQLYNISSSLMLTDSVADLNYSCTVSTRRNRRRATLRQLPSVSSSTTHLTIPCTATNTSLSSFSLVWRFNHRQTIVNQTGTNVTNRVSEEWRRHVKDVSESGSLTLQDLSSKQEGIYTCELRNAEETHITNTLLRIETGSHTVVAVVITAVVFGVVLVVLLAGLLYRWIRGAGRSGNSDGHETGDQPGETETNF